MSRPRAARRMRRAWVLLVGALGLNCRDGAGPDLSAGPLALVPMFESSSAGQIDFDRMRITLAHPDGGPALDTVIATPPSMDPIDVSLRVPLTAAREELLLYLRLINSAGDTVLRNDPYPQSVTVTAGGSAAPVPVTIRATVGSIVVSPVEGVFSSLGETRQFAATTLDDNGMPLAAQPASFAWSSSAPGVATVDPATGLVTAVSNGTATISARTSGVSGDVLVTVSQLATQLVFITPPSTVVAGLVIAPPIGLAVQDARGNAVGGFIDVVTIALDVNPGPSQLTGTTTKAAVNGVVLFADLRLDQPGVGYTFVASVAGLPPVISLPFEVRPAPAAVYWINPAGGLWSNASNWSSGVVPGSADHAIITVAGSYTVTLDVDATFAGLTIGGPSGTQTLTVASRTVSVAGGAQVNPNGVLQMRAATLNGALANGSTVFVEGSTLVNGSVTASAGSLTRLQGNGIYGTATLTVAGGFTNNGSIVLTDITSSYGATLTVTTGALANNASGVIRAEVGGLGSRQLNAALNNQGTLTVLRPLTLSRASATHTNSGTIDVNGGDLTISQSGAGPSFTNSGTITIASGDSVKVTGGGFTYSAGTISGSTGTLTFSSVTVGLTPGLSTGAVGLSLTSSTVNGPGTLTVATGTTLIARASTITAPVTNQGTLVVNGTSTFSTIINGIGATLQVEGNGIYGLANLTVANDFLNRGAIVLTDVTSSFGATLTMPAGATLTNALGATIDAAVGAGGSRTLALEIDNQGTIKLLRPLTIGRAGAAHLNSGTIDVSGGHLMINQSGTGPSFTNTGSITIGATDSLRLTGGAFNYTSGAITGGTLAISSAVVTATQDFTTATSALGLTTTTWGGSGILTVASGTTLVVRASTITAPLVNEGTLVVQGTSAFNGSVTHIADARLRLQGNGIFGTANLTVALDFTNDGIIELTDTSSAFGATLTMPAGSALINAVGATIEAAAGAAGTHTLALALDNRGTLTLNRALTINRAGASHLNRGSIDVIGGNLTVTQSGTSPSFTNTGSITIATGDSVKVSSGAFNYTSGTISGAGTLAFTSAAVTADQDFSTATAALSLSNSTWGGSGVLTVAGSTSLVIQASTINAALVNQGILVAHGTSAFNGSLTNVAGAMLRVEGNGIFGTGNLTVANGFTNNGAIELTDVGSAFGANINVTNGTLTNEGTISVLTGAGGGRSLGAVLDNRGALTVAVAPGRALTIGHADAAHQNSGTIDVSSGNVTINQTGTSPIFTNTSVGSITLAAEDTLTLNNGAFADDGAFGGAGTLVLNSVNAAAFNAAHTLGAITLSNTAASFATDQSTDNTNFLFTNNSVVSGPGLLTNVTFATLKLQSSTIATQLINHGDLIVNGSSSLAGPVITMSGSFVRIEGNGFFGAGTLSVTDIGGLINNGTIQLTDVSSAFGATIKVTKAPLVNVGMIDVQPGANGPRTVDAVVSNQGIITVGQGLTVVQQDNGSFANLAGGLVDIGKGQTLRIPLGSVTNSLNGRIIGSGALDVRSPARFTNDGELAPGKSPEILTVAGDPSLTTTSIVSIELGGTVLGAEYDQLAISGNAVLAGDLNVVLINGFVPKAGDEFRVVTYASANGGFRTNLPTLPNGLIWQVDTTSDPKALILRVIVG